MAVHDNTAVESWKSFFSGWVRYFGMPEMVVTDGGGEYLGAFGEQAEETVCYSACVTPRARGRTARRSATGGC